MTAVEVLGQWTLDTLSDRLGLNVLILLSTVVAAMTSFICWGFARNLAPLILFSLLFGFFAYGFFSDLVRMSMAVNRQPTAALPSFGIFIFC